MSTPIQRVVQSRYVRTYIVRTRARVAPTFLDITPPFVRENKSDARGVKIEANTAVCGT